MEGRDWDSIGAIKRHHANMALHKMEIDLQLLQSARWKKQACDAEIKLLKKK